MFPSRNIKVKRRMTIKYPSTECSSGSGSSERVVSACLCIVNVHKRPYYDYGSISIVWLYLCYLPYVAKNPVSKVRVSPVTRALL